MRNNKILISVFFCFLVVFNLSAIDPSRYHENSTLQWTWAVMSLDSLEIHGNEHILDIGSGDGKISALLSKKVPVGMVLGIDSSKATVKFAKKHYSQKAYPNLAFETADAQNLSYKAKYDIVTSFLCLNWVRDIEKTIKGIATALKPGGKALIVVPAPGDEKELEAWKASINSERWKPHLHLLGYHNRHSLEEYEQFIFSAGLIPLKMESIKTSVVFHDKKEFINWMRAISPQLKKLPKDLYNELIDMRLTSIITSYPQANDGRFYAFPEKLEILVEKPY